MAGKTSTATASHLADSQRKNAAPTLGEEFPRVVQVTIRVERIGSNGLRSGVEEYVFHPAAKAYFSIGCLGGYKHNGFDLNEDVRNLMASGAFEAPVKVRCSGSTAKPGGVSAPCSCMLEGRLTVTYS